MTQMVLFLLAACSNPAVDGRDGADGSDGADGTSCWDVDGDGVNDPEEDRDGNGIWNADDCGAATSADSGLEIAPYLGDLHLTSEAAAELFCDRHASIYGDLVVEYVATDLSALSCLVEVDGELTLWDSTEDNSLPELVLVTGDMIVRGSEPASFDSLEAVGGLEARAVSGLSAPELVEVQGDVHLGDWLGALDLSSLRQVDGYFVLELSMELANVDGLSALETVAGDRLEITGNANLASLDGLSEVTRVDGNLIVRDNPTLPQADAQAWAQGIDTIGGSIVVSGNGE